MVPAIMTILNGQCFKINIMHLFQLQYGIQEETGDRISGPTLQKFLNAVKQKPSTQNSRVSSCSKIIKKNKRKQNSIKDTKFVIPISNRENYLVHISNGQGSIL